MSALRLAVLPLLIAATAAAADKPTGLPKTSPFVSASTPTGAADSSAENIEFAGVIIGQKTDLVFHDKRSKKNHWIEKGETKEGISVLSYDEVREQVQVKINGVEKTLPLRKNARGGAAPRPVAPLQLGFNVPTAAPAGTSATGAVDLSTVTGTAGGNASNAQPAAANTPPPAPNTPEAITRQETEARMLVSDLLEIGMAQRKAYEDAQRKAAQGDSTTPATPTAPSPTVPDASR